MNTEAEQKKDRLLREWDEARASFLAHHGLPLPDIHEDNDRATRAAAVAQIGVEDRIATSEEEHLEEVEQALARLEAGTYGVCADCEKAIRTQRLAALPVALRCTACQEKAEGRTV